MRGKGNVSESNVDKNSSNRSEDVTGHFFVRFFKPRSKF